MGHIILWLRGDKSYFTSVLLGLVLAREGERGSKGKGGGYSSLMYDEGKLFATPKSPHVLVAKTWYHTLQVLG